MNADQYLAQMQALLPQGGAWPRDHDAVLTGLLRSFADEMERLDARADRLLDEIDPRAAVELLADWERVAGLPEDCAPSVAQSTQQRREALIAKLTDSGGQSVASFIALAQALGYAITIDEFDESVCGQMQCGQPLMGSDWATAWRVNAPLFSPYQFICGASACGDPLGGASNTPLECSFDHLKPAHTFVFFQYT
jgi:uncharacterized protein YmfQ (DUF2313 family)